MNATEYQALYLVIVLVALAYVALGVWFWRACKNAPLDPDDGYPFSDEGRAVLRTRARQEGRYWSE